MSAADCICYITAQCPVSQPATDDRHLVTNQTLATSMHCIACCVCPVPDACVLTAVSSSATNPRCNDFSTHTSIVSLYTCTGNSLLCITQLNTDLFWMLLSCLAYRGIPELLNNNNPSTPQIACNIASMCTLVALSACTKACCEGNYCSCKLSALLSSLAPFASFHKLKDCWHSCVYPPG